jgi:hypothetical protein
MSQGSAGFFCRAISDLDWPTDISGLDKIFGCSSAYGRRSDAVKERPFQGRV